MVATHEAIARIWQAILDIRPDGPLTGMDVATMMEALKIARRYQGAWNEEDYLDAAGYAAVAFECGRGG